MFMERGWPFDGRVPDFEDTINLFAAVDTPVRDTLLELLRRFRHLPSAAYEDLIFEFFERHRTTLRVAVAGRRVVLVPVIAPKDDGRIKGSTRVGVEIKDHLLGDLEHLLDAPSVQLLSDPRAFREWRGSEEAEASGPWFVLFLEDFVGSGDSMLEFCEAQIPNLAAGDDWRVATLVTLERGRLAVEAAYPGCLLAGEVHSRAISDSYPTEVAQEMLAHMGTVFKLLKVKKKYRLGYAESEAIIAMARTPNNTFPAFWCTQGRGAVWPAPFPRI